MSRRLKILQAIFARAEVAADASAASVRKQSTVRLAELLREKNPKLRFKGLADPALTEFDKAILDRSLSSQLPVFRRRHPIGLRNRISTIGRHAVYHRRVLTRFGILICLLLAGAVTTYMHTPVGRSATINRTLEITWTMPDGTTYKKQEEKGTRLVLLTKQDGGYTVRRWFDYVGYGETPISAAFVNQYFSTDRAP